MEQKFAELSRAESIAEVIGVTRDFLASFSREEMMSLPAGCRPAWVHGVHDIESWADRLIGQKDKVVLMMEDERRFDRLTSHFLIASMRIRQLARDQAVFRSIGQRAVG